MIRQTLDKAKRPVTDSTPHRSSFEHDLSNALASGRSERLLQGANEAIALPHRLRLIDIEARHRLAQYRSHYSPNQPRARGPPRRRAMDRYRRRVWNAARGCGQASAGPRGHCRNRLAAGLAGDRSLSRQRTALGSARKQRAQRNRGYDHRRRGHLRGQLRVARIHFGRFCRSEEIARHLGEEISDHV
jgi:hypothetical protein